MPSRGGYPGRKEKMRRTAVLIIRQDDGQWIPDRKITCEVTGEMVDGTKIWTDIESGEQYWLTRMLGKYMFFKG